MDALWLSRITWLLCVRSGPDPCFNLSAAQHRLFTPLLLLLPLRLCQVREKYTSERKRTRANIYYEQRPAELYTICIYVYIVDLPLSIHSTYLYTTHSRIFWHTPTTSPPAKYLNQYYIIYYWTPCVTYLYCPGLIRKHTGITNCYLFC